MQVVLLPKGKAWPGGGVDKPDDKELEIQAGLPPEHVAGHAGGMAKGHGETPQSLLAHPGLAKMR
jgi:hypothetical protein